MNSRILIALLFLTLTGPTLADPPVLNDVEDPTPVDWKEDDFAFPRMPQEENLLEFYVNATSAAKYYIDWTSLITGTPDMVVRYVVVTKTAGGARTISFEGVRCDTSEARLYATLNSTGQWSNARNSEWRKVSKDRAVHQYALTYLYFCPDFTPIKTRKEGRNAVENGGHPIVKQRYN